MKINGELIILITFIGLLIQAFILEITFKKEIKKMINHEEFIELCKRLVYENEISKEVSDEWTGINIFMEDVFVVWSCKTLQNSKAILSATNKGAYMYEFTLNGDKEVIYRDTYKKINNTEITNIDLK